MGSTLAALSNRVLSEAEKNESGLHDWSNECFSEIIEAAQKVIMWTKNNGKFVVSELLF